MTTAGAAAGKINLTEVMDNGRVGWLQVRVFALCLASLIMDGFDVQAMGYLATEMFREWNEPPPSLGVLLRDGNLGVLVGALVFSMVADKVGRRPVLVYATFFFAIMTLATAFARNLEEMRLLRFIAGIGMGTIIPNATALVGEFSPKRTRVAWIMCITMGFTLGAAFGGFIANWLIPLWGWRSVLVFGGVVPLIIAVLMVFGLPESLQFLAVRRKRFDLLARWLSQLDSKIRIDQNTQFVSSETSKTGVPLWHLFREGRALVTALLWLVNFTNILVLYSLSGWLPTIFQNLMGYERSTAIMLGTVVQVGGTVGASGSRG
jgi:AAHS family 4-hydroxybenzoate transporter-like MFS transporter